MMRVIKILLAIGLAFIVFGPGLKLLRVNTKSVTQGETSQPAQAAVTSSTPSSASAVPPAKAAPTTPTWTYHLSDDPMTGKKKSFAIVQSSGTFQLSFPYSGSQHAQVMLRKDPRKGREIIFEIERGQLICEVSSCSIPVRFDDDKPMSFTASPPSDHTSTALFIDPVDAFYKRLLRAKVLRIEPTIYQHGSIVAEFNVQGFEPEKF